ncbi:hypothetical protein N7481_010679 [Penicillium waksmanii]|uniref:uncharacterized protein n=1 Tax=Penicillium waksmanii TaxID=69791 RepID=UPI0025486E0A|nr:uncharacterized protein N7481_010679 [Penicillium waksmanii]KAJ5973469.1 hypothetical protein N7481_010679 [Penicillium waksmanii]
MAPASLQPSRRSFRLVHGTGLVLILAIFYKLFIHDIVFEKPTPIPTDRNVGGFSWRCTRLEHPLMEGCEHLWLDHKNRKLYGTCSNFSTHTDTSVESDYPTMARRDHVSVMEIDSPPGQDNAYNLHRLEVADGFKGELDLHGLDARRIGDQLRFWLINHRPFVNADTGEIIEEKKNYTVEVFDLDEDAGALVPVKTISSELLDSPNNLAVDTTGDGILVINDHVTKVGPFRGGKEVVGDANLAECQTDSGECRLITTKGFGYANGIVIDSQEHIYVPGVSGVVLVYEMEYGELKLLNSFRTSLGIDRISVNAEDSIVITAFPDSLELIKASTNPLDPVPGATLLLAKRETINPEQSEEQGYQAYFLITDEDGELMPSTTIAVHDVKTDRLFLTGIFSRGINICTQRAMK